MRHRPISETNFETPLCNGLLELLMPAALGSFGILACSRKEQVSDSLCKSAAYEKRPP